jgi:hypothetical protein
MDFPFACPAGPTGSAIPGVAIATVIATEIATKTRRRQVEGIIITG